MKLSDKCRLCLIKSSSSSDEIFFPIDPGFERKFVEITNGRVKFAKPQTQEEVKKFPDKVCMSCVSELEQHYNYRNGLIEKQNRLNILLGVNEEEIEESVEPPQVIKVEQCSDMEFYDSDDEEQRQKPNDLIVADPIENIDERLKESEGIEKTDFDPEYEAEYCEQYDNYGQLESHEEVYEDHEAITSESEEIGDDRFGGAIINVMPIEKLEENCNIEQESDNYEYFIKESSDTDDESDVVYEDDITMEDDLVPCYVKRKYTKQAKDAPKQFKCWVRECGATFSFRATMKKHMLQLHKISCNKSTCFICGQRHDNYAAFLAHVKLHTRKSECDVCKLTFVNDERMQNHKARFHKSNEDERKFKCHICNARFNRKEHLNSHTIYKHSDKDARKFPCKECSSTFLTRQDQKNHEKSHSQVKIQCVYCSYDCRDLKSIKRHCIKLHNTAKIYKCNCDETFELFRELQSHKKNCGYETVDVVVT